MKMKPMVECVVFHAPQDMHIITGCPSDLVRFESIQPNHHFAMLECFRLKNRYAPKNPSGYPAEVYHYCTVDQWKEYWNTEQQLSFT